MSVFLIVLTALIVAGVGFLLQRRRAARHERAVRIARESPPPIEPGRTPPAVFFDRGHTWLFLEESGIARLGIDEFARSLVREIDGVETPEVGRRVAKGDVIVKLRHGNRTASFLSPIDGVVEEVNTELLKSRDLGRAETFTAAWLCKIAPTDTSQVSASLLLGDAARRWLEHEVQRLKVFLATLAPNSPALGTTMQDGGLPHAALIDELRGGDWRKLQERFFG